MAARRSVSLCRSLLLRPSVGLETSSRRGFHQSRYGILNQYPASRSSFTTELTGLTNQKRWASRAATAAAAAARTSVDDNKISIGPKKGKLEKDARETEVLYEGPISSTIKKVKLLSLSTCCLSVSLGPVITFMTSPELNVILKGGVASTVIFLSASTTAALHWFVSPYIHKLKWQPGSPTFDVEMMSWLATPLPRTIRFADVRAPETKRPFVTFKADDNFYFVDAEHCNNKALLARLTPEKPSGQGSALKNI